MDMKIVTIGKPVLNEIHHAEVIRVPVAVAQVVLARMGAPYESGPMVSRWAGAFELSPFIRTFPVAFEIVVCQRGASIRCHWDHAALVREIIDRMVPEIIVEVIEQPIMRAA